MPINTRTGSKNFTSDSPWPDSGVVSDHRSPIAGEKP